MLLHQRGGDRSPSNGSSGILEDVIPTALIAGLVLGRWWWTPLLVGIAWALLVGIDASCRGSCSVGAFALGTVNAAVGMAIHRGVRALVDRVNRANREPA